MKIIWKYSLLNIVVFDSQVVQVDNMSQKLVVEWCFQICFTLLACYILIICALIDGFLGVLSADTLFISLTPGCCVLVSCALLFSSSFMLNPNHPSIHPYVMSSIFNNPVTLSLSGRGFNPSFQLCSCLSNHVVRHVPTICCLFLGALIRFFFLPTISSTASFDMCCVHETFISTLQMLAVFWDHVSLEPTPRFHTVMTGFSGLTNRCRSKGRRNSASVCWMVRICQFHESCSTVQTVPHQCCLDPPIDRDNTWPAGWLHGVPVLSAMTEMRSRLIARLIPLLCYVCSWCFVPV